MAKQNKCNKAIVALMTLKDKNMNDLADVVGMTEGSLRTKLSRGAYKLEDLIIYAKFLGVDIGFKDGDNFYSFIDHKKNDTD